MVAATTRKASNEPGGLYSGERGNTISLNSLVVSIPPDRNRKIGKIQWPSRMPPNPEREFAVLKVGKVVSEKQAHEWFRKNRNTKRQVLIFVHGYNNSYADAVFRLAQIVHDSGADAAPILFAWPSRGRAFDYLYDKESANFSRRALEDLILQTTRSPDVADVTVLAHSMGTWLAAEALRGVAMREGSIPAKVKTVVLASPDIDIDVFRRQFIEMGPKRPLFAILTSTHDRALGLSRMLSGGVRRVGGTDLKPYAAVLAQMGVRVIDTSAIASNDPLGHTTFADDPEIVRLLGRHLAGQSMEGTKGSVVGQMGGSAQEALRRDLSPRTGELVDGRVLY
ncbi:alpha/beta hydrolase [Mesorhizobium sp. L-8-3]|uniref:alpha/beta hydrolase n=1 Tax=Mesorhizobium sp. L-8-3 TaxID=2744522 RepID=UPI0019350041|nr:alpha/beta hydrolase [Mesorhizobium sp. L-8-3]BCH21576.1 esterase [Mesorhizobium sp. L-8-3]